MVIALGSVACGDDEASEEDIAAVRAAIAANLAAEEAGDVNAYFATVTDDFVNNTFAPFGLTEDMIRAAPEEFFGNSASIDPADVEIDVDGDTATGVVGERSQDALSISWVKATLINQNGTWLLDRIEPADAGEKPDGAQEIDVSMQDYAFSFDEDEFETGKPTVFKLRNDGEKPHFMLFAKIPDDANLEELLQSEEEPEGVVTVADSFVFQAGQEGEVTVSQPLEAGRYVMLCFITEPPGDWENGTPHAFMGMQSDFRID